MATRTFEALASVIRAGRGYAPGQRFTADDRDPQIADAVAFGLVKPVAEKAAKPVNRVTSRKGKTR